MNPFRSLLISLSRMPPSLMLVIIIALAILVTTLVMNQVGEKQREVERMKQEQEAKANLKVKVVYASKDLEEGEIIAPEALEEKDVEASKAPPDAFSSVAGVVGGIAAYPIPAGTIVSQHALRPRGFQTGFVGKIKDGMRAVTFAVDPNSGVAGFIYPDSHVDIICTAGSGPDTKAAPVLSNVEVIAVGGTYVKQPGQQNATPASSVTVTVSPGDAQKLIKAVMAGKLYLTLRGEKDASPVPVVDITSLFPKQEKAMAELAGLPPPNLPPPPLPPGMPGMGGNAPPPPPPMHEIELWSGSKKEVLSVPSN